MQRLHKCENNSQLRKGIRKVMYVLVKKGCVDVLECGTAGECKKNKTRTN